MPALSFFTLSELYEEIRSRADGTLILQFFPQPQKDEPGYLFEAGTDLIPAEAPRVFHHIRELFRGSPPNRRHYQPPSGG